MPKQKAPLRPTLNPAAPRRRTQKRDDPRLHVRPIQSRYIEPEGVERDGGRGIILHGAEGPVERESFEEPRPGERHQFRLVVSPETPPSSISPTAFAGTWAVSRSSAGSSSGPL
jgi:hypothetical protein